MSHQSIVMPGAVLGVGTSLIARERTARAHSSSATAQAEGPDRGGGGADGWMDGETLVLAVWAGVCFRVLFACVLSWVEICVCRDDFGRRSDKLAGP